MKKLYEKFFYVPQYGKVTETVFKTRTILSLVTCFVCMVLLSATTLAYFTFSVSSGENTMTAGNYSLQVVTNGADVSGGYTCPADGLHTFTLTPNGTSDMGYCKVTVSANGTSSEYYTKQISISGQNGTAKNLILTVNAAEGSTITFQPQWGTSVNYAVDQGALYGDGHIIGTTATAFEEPQEQPEQPQEEEPAEPEQGQQEQPEQQTPPAVTDPTDPPVQTDPPAVTDPTEPPVQTDPPAEPDPTDPPAETDPPTQTEGE